MMYKHIRFSRGQSPGSPRNGIILTYIKQSGESNGDAGDQYIRLDDQRWIPASTPSSPTDRFQYGYDRDGNVLYKDNKIKSTFSELYHANSSASGDNNTAYDNLNRLTAFRRGTLSASANNSGGLDTVSTLNSNSNSSQSYTLDAVGNQTSVTTDGTAQTNTVNSQNEETAAGSNNLAFDNNGNTTTDDQGHTLVYDAWNRLVTVKNGSTTLVSYAYDVDGNRISRTASGTTTDLYNSAAGQVLEERQSGTVTDQYVWSLAYVNALVLRDDNTTSGSYGKSGSGVGERLYAQQDANFNVTTLTDTSGVVKQRFDYTPYGVMTVIDGTTNWSTTTDSYSWVYTFQGGRYDATTGMIHFGAREYSPSLGRWMQQDRAGYLDGPDRYQFVGSAPVNRFDPSGLAGANDSRVQTVIPPPTDLPTPPPQFTDFPLPGPNAKDQTDFRQKYVDSPGWGRTDGPWVRDPDGNWTHPGNIRTRLTRFKMPTNPPSCLTEADKRSLQQAIDNFNAKALQHEQEAQAWYQQYYAQGGSDTPPDAAFNRAHEDKCAGNAQWETSELLKMYQLLKAAYQKCKCPNAPADRIDKSLDDKISSNRDKLIYGPQAPKP